MGFLNKEKWIENEESGIRIAGDVVTETALTDRMQDDLMKLEDDSWWFTYRADVITRMMDRYFSKEKMTLDIGGGNGYTSSVASNKGYFMGIIEPSMKACQHARKRGISEVNCGAVTENSVLDESMEQVLLLDVLEHIEDDKRFVKLLYQKLVRRGYLLITVPAFMCLWSSEDDAAGHFRRYRMPELRELLEAQGFHICYQSYFMGFLFLPILLIRVILEKLGFIKKQENRSEEERAAIANHQFKLRSGLIKSILVFFEEMEKQLMKKEKRVLFGSSIIVIARKDEAWDGKK